MIKKYKDTDMEDVLSIWFASSSLAHHFLKDAFMEKEKHNIREIYLPNTETWMYQKNDRNIGFISMIGNEIGAVFVLPDHQGKGIGTQLVNHIAQLHGELEVEVFKRNEIGRPFYDKYGFTFLKEYIHEETGEVVLRLKFVC